MAGSSKILVCAPQESYAYIQKPGAEGAEVKFEKIPVVLESKKFPKLSYTENLYGATPLKGITVAVPAAKFIQGLYIPKLMLKSILFVKIFPHESNTLTQYWPGHSLAKKF